MTKYIITKCKDRFVSAVYEDDLCTQLYFKNESNVLNNIYVGRVENIVKNINCAFIEIQKGEKCYYPLDSEKRHIFLNSKNNEKLNIGDYILVQVNKEAVKTKPPTVTGKVGLTGKYVVLNTDVDGVRVSSKCKNVDVIEKIKISLLENLQFECLGIAFGFIIRTNAKDATAEDVVNEAKALYLQFEKIIKRAKYHNGIELLYSDESYIFKGLYNISEDNLSSIITDDEKIFNLIASKNVFSPEKLRFYNDKLLPLYKLYDIEKTINSAISKKVWLKCGGYIIIEHTEALTSIDVNSGKCISKKSAPLEKEKTVLKVNVEAAKEIAYQLMLRNISGMIIVDFINMSREESVEVLTDTIKKSIKKDKISTDFIDITKLGLFELTRKREGKSINEELCDLL